MKRILFLKSAICCPFLSEIFGLQYLTVHFQRHLEDFSVAYFGFKIVEIQCSEHPRTTESHNFIAENCSEFVIFSSLKKNIGGSLKSPTLVLGMKS